MNTPVGLNPAQAATMLKLQDHLNSMINPAWVTSGSRFLRAAFVESAEALEHHGWKWWKKQTIDLPQVQMELVDILHFYLSHTIVQAGGSIEGAAAELMRDLAGPGTVTLDGAMRELATLDVPELLELIGGLAVCGRASFKVLERTMTACEMGWNDAYTQYVSKNVLNLFRQRHGYKEGTYIKIWNGEEDNVVLARLMSALDPAQADFADQLQDQLEQAYAVVVPGPQRRFQIKAPPCQRRFSCVPNPRQRWPKRVSPNSALCSRGCERQYWRGASTCPPSCAAACQGQRGSYSMPRASATMSACLLATISSAWAASVISPTAIVGMPTRRLISAAKGTW